MDYYNNYYDNNYNVQYIKSLLWTRYDSDTIINITNNIDKLDEAILFYKNISIVEYIFTILFYEELTILFPINCNFKDKLLNIIYFIKTRYKNKNKTEKNNKEYQIIKYIFSNIYQKIIDI